MQKMYDSWETRTTNEEVLHGEISMQEAESEWVYDIPSSLLSLEAIESPLMAEDAARQYGLDADLAAETAEGTKLLMSDGCHKYLVRDTALTTIGETAKLFGSALGRMNVPTYCETMNNGLAVAKGNSLMLLRRGKLSALHSCSESGYEILNQEELFRVAKANLEQSFGELDFKEGFINHGYTSCVWSLPDAQEEILTAYQDALKNSVTHHYAISMMPAVRFITSDTAKSCARLVPVFMYQGYEYTLIDGIEIKHTKKKNNGSLTGMDAWKTETQLMFSQFQKSIQQIEALAGITILNGTNTVVSLCKRYGIPKKYGDAAREVVENLTSGGRRISAHDLYLSMYAAIKEAKTANASNSVLINLQESIAKIAQTDWSMHDVGGVVAW